MLDDLLRRVVFVLLDLDLDLGRRMGGVKERNGMKKRLTAIGVGRRRLAPPWGWREREKENLNCHPNASSSPALSFWRISSHARSRS